MFHVQDYLFMFPLAFHGTMIIHQEDRTQRSIDLMTLDFALYHRSGLTLVDKS